MPKPKPKSKNSGAVSSIYVPDLDKIEEEKSDEGSERVEVKSLGRKSKAKR